MPQYSMVVNFKLLQRITDYSCHVEDWYQTLICQSSEISRLAFQNQKIF